MFNQQYYTSPRRAGVESGTTLDSLFSDDFGGNAVNGSNWTTLDGGLAANQGLGGPILTQANIGSGITGITDSVVSSALTVSMGTTLGAERWYLSNRTFAGKEDVLVVLNKSQALAANSIFIGLVEVDAATEVPLLNPNFAADGNGASEFTNRGGCEFGLSATATAYQAEAIGDSSASKAVGVVGIAAAWTTTQECLIEIDSRDIIVQTASIDAVAPKVTTASRVSSQCPNDQKLYKLLLRFRNVTTPGSNTNVVIQRILVADNYEQRVQISSGEGDQIGNKAVGVNVTSAVAGVIQGTAVAAAATGIGWFVDPDNFLSADIASAAITTTTTTAAITPKSAGGVAEINCIVTAVSGTSPTLDLSIDESDDGGTNWFRVYDFPRITATGAYRSPPLFLVGNRVRYVQTIGGTSPSFTRSVNRIVQGGTDTTRVNQIVDRTISLTALNSSTATLKTRGAKNVQLVINVGAATTAPILQLQGSDDNGATWYAIGSTLTAVASSTVQLTATDIHAELIRATVSTAGATVTAGYTLVKAFG